MLALLLFVCASVVSYVTLAYILTFHENCLLREASLLGKKRINLLSAE